MKTWASNSINARLRLIRPELGFSVRLLSERRKKSKAKRCTVIHTVSYEISMEKNNEIHIISNLPCIEHTTEKKNMEDSPHFAIRKKQAEEEFRKNNSDCDEVRLFTVHIRLGGRVKPATLPICISLVDPLDFRLRKPKIRRSARGSYHREGWLIN